jgi:antitoxin (DNA-binding transcriptional repressor) of toxin-antitoxin stability system
MPTVSAFQAKTRFGESLDRVGRGEAIVITRHDKPMARFIGLILATVAIGTGCTAVPEQEVCMSDADRRARIATEDLSPWERERLDQEQRFQEDRRN